jgi:TRAP-type C4-dicarboxylate transport system substrate-binding protein
MTMRLAALIAAALIALAAPAGAAEVTEIFLAHTRPHDAAAEPEAAAADEFKRQVEQHSTGRLKVGIFPDGHLGGNRDMVRLVKRGIIQAAIVTVGGIASDYPLITAVEMPFALASPEAADRVFDGPFGQALAADIAKRTAFTVLAFGDGGGFYLVTNDRRPVRNPADMQDLKIRSIPGVAVFDAMIRGLGGTPVPVSSRQEYTALATHVLDGRMGPPMPMLSGRFDEVQKYATLTGHLYLPTLLIYNRDALARLDAGDREAVRQAAIAAMAVGRRLGREIEASDRGLPALKRRMTVTTLTPAEREAFRAATQPAVAAAIADTLGDDGRRLLEDFLAAAQAAR